MENLSKVLRIVESNKFVLESSYDFSMLAMDIMNIIQRKFKPFDPEMITLFENFDFTKDTLPEEITSFEIGHDEILRFKGLSDYKRIDKAFDELRTSEIRFVNGKSSSDFDFHYGKSNFLTSWTHYPNRRKYIAQITPFATRYLYAVKSLNGGFTNIDSEQRLKLGFKASKRWLSILSNLSTRNNKSQIYTLDDLREIFNKPNFTWNHIRIRLLSEAFEDIWDNTNLRPRYKPIKKGKSVISVLITLDKEGETIEIPFSEPEKAFSQDINKQWIGKEAYQNMCTYIDTIHDIPEKKKTQYKTKIPLNVLNMIIFDHQHKPWERERVIKLQDKHEWFRYHIERAFQKREYFSVTRKVFIPFEQ